MKILMLKGLPASGKSTYAKELIKTQPNWIRVNKDDIREMLNGGKWSKDNEKQVLIVRDNLIYQYITAGYNVVVDDTNLNPKHEKQVKEIAKQLNADFEIKFFDVSISECIKRDAKREKPVGKKVIWEMYMNYIFKPDKFKEWAEEDGKPKAILLDLDGTIAHASNRSPYDYSKVKDDVCDVFIKDIVLKYYNDGFEIIAASGREDGCRDDTRDWLMNNGIPVRKLFMRKTGDHRKDCIVKKEIFENEIKPKWNIFFCLDDRNQVVDMYRSLGLKVLQCENGDF